MFTRVVIEWQIISQNCMNYNQANTFFLLFPIQLHSFRFPRCSNDKHRPNLLPLTWYKHTQTKQQQHQQITSRPRLKEKRSKEKIHSIRLRSAQKFYSLTNVSPGFFPPWYDIAVNV